MAFKLSTKMLAIAGCAAAVMAVAAPSIASADIKWAVTGTFEDGGTVSGYFNINQYGYLDGYNLQTTSGSTLPGYDYTPSDSFFSNNNFYVDAQPGYQADLHLAFADDLTVPTTNNPILTDPASWECAGSYSCFDLDGGTTRFIGSGSASASVPEPATWAMLMVGFGGIGFALRTARRNATVSAVAI